MYLINNYNYYIKFEFIVIDNQVFVEKTNHNKNNRPYERGDLKSFSEIWKYQDERKQDFITVSTVHTFFLTYIFLFQYKGKFLLQDCFPNECNNLTFQRDPKSVSSDYSTCSDVFSKDKGNFYLLNY